MKLMFFCCAFLGMSVIGLSQSDDSVSKQLLDDVFKQLETDIESAIAMRMPIAQLKSELADLANQSDLGAISRERLYELNQGLCLLQASSESKRVSETWIPGLRSLASRECKSKESKALLFAITLNVHFLANAPAAEIWELILKSDVETKIAFSELLDSVHWSSSKDFTKNLDSLYSLPGEDGDRLRRQILEANQRAMEIGLCDEDIALDVFALLLENPYTQLEGAKAMMLSLRICRYHERFFSRAPR